MSTKVQFVEGENTIEFILKVSKILNFAQVPADKLNPMNLKIGRSEDLPLFYFKTMDGPEGELLEKYVYSDENPDVLLDLANVPNQNLELVLFTSFKGKIFDGVIRKSNLSGGEYEVEEIEVKVFIDTDFIPRIDFSKPNDTYQGEIPGLTIKSVVPAEDQEGIRKAAFEGMNKEFKIQEITMMDNTKFYGIKMSGVDLIESNDLTEEGYTIRQAEYKTIITDKSKIFEGEIDYDIFNKEGNKTATFHFVPVTSLEQSQTQTETKLTIIGFTKLPEDRIGELSIKVEGDKDLILKTTEITISQLIVNLINNIESRELYSNEVVEDFTAEKEFIMNVHGHYDNRTEINVKLIEQADLGEEELAKQKEQAAKAGYDMVSLPIAKGELKVPKKVYVHQKIEKIIYVNTEIVGESCDIFSFEDDKGVVGIGDVLMVNDDNRDTNFKDNVDVKYNLKKKNEMIAETTIELKCKNKEDSQIFYNYFLIKKRELEVDDSNVTLSFEDIFNYIEGKTNFYLEVLRNRAKIKDENYKTNINFDTKVEDIKTIYNKLSNIYDIEDLNDQIIEDSTLDNLTMFNAIIQHIADDHTIKSNSLTEGKSHLIVNFVKKVINNKELLELKGKQNLLSLYYSSYNFPYAILTRQSKFKKNILEILMKNTGKNITKPFTGKKNIGQDKFIENHKITFLEQVVNKADFFTIQYYFNLESGDVNVNQSIYLMIDTLMRDTTLFHILYNNFVKKVKLMIIRSGANITKKLPLGDFEIDDFVNGLKVDEKQNMKTYFERKEIGLIIHYFSKCMNKLIQVHCENLKGGGARKFLTFVPNNHLSIKDIVEFGDVKFIHDKTKKRIQIPDDCITTDKGKDAMYEEINEPFTIIKKLFNDINKGEKEKKILLETPSEWGKFFSPLPLNMGFYHNYRWVFNQEVGVEPLSQVNINKELENIPNKPESFPKQGDEFDYFGLVYHNNKGKFKYISKQSEMKTIVEDVFNFERKAREAFDFSNISAEGGNQKASRSDDKISKNIYILVKKKGDGKLELLPLFLRVLQDGKKKFIPIIQPSDILNNPTYSPAVGPLESGNNSNQVNKINPAYELGNGRPTTANTTYDTAAGLMESGNNINRPNPAYELRNGRPTTANPTYDIAAPSNVNDKPDNAPTGVSPFFNLQSGEKCSRVSFSESISESIFSWESISTFQNQNSEFIQMLNSLESEEKKEYNDSLNGLKPFGILWDPCLGGGISDKSVLTTNFRLKVFEKDKEVEEKCEIKKKYGMGITGSYTHKIYETNNENVIQQTFWKQNEKVKIREDFKKDIRKNYCLDDENRELSFLSLIYLNKKEEWEYLINFNDIKKYFEDIKSFKKDIKSIKKESNRKEEWSDSDLKKNIFSLVKNEKNKYYVLPLFIRSNMIKKYTLLFKDMPSLPVSPEIAFNPLGEYTDLPGSDGTLASNKGEGNNQSEREEVKGVVSDFARGLERQANPNPTYENLMSAVGKDLPPEFIRELHKLSQKQASGVSHGNASTTPGRKSSENGSPGSTSTTPEGKASKTVSQGSASITPGGKAITPGGKVSHIPGNEPLREEAQTTASNPPPTSVQPPDGCVKGFLRQIRINDQLTGKIVYIKKEPNNWSWVIVEDLIKTGANKTTYCDCLLYIEPTKDKGHILTPLPGGWRFVKVAGTLGSVGQQISFSVNRYLGQETTAANTAQLGADSESLSILTPAARAQYNKEGKLKQEKVKFLAQIILKVENISIPRGLKINYFENKYKLESEFSCYLSDKWQKERSFYGTVKKRIVLDKKLFWEDSQSRTPPDKKSIYSTNHYEKLKNKDGLQFNENEGERIGFIVNSSKNYLGVSTNGIMRACTNHVIIYQVTGDKTPKGLEENLIPGINKFDDFINKEGYNDIESWKKKIYHHFMFFNPDNTCSQGTKFGKYILPSVSGGGSKRRIRQMPPPEIKNRWTTKKIKNISNVNTKNKKNNNKSKKLNKIRKN